MRALVLCGGGAKLHYQVGAAKALILAGQHYSLFSGVGSGALIATYLAQFPAGFEEEAAACLEDAAKSLRSRRVFRHWVTGRARGLWGSSFYSSEPLRRFVREEINAEAARHSGKQLRIFAVSLDGGEFCAFSETCEKLHDAVLAATALPGMLEPVEMRGQLWLDGGARMMTPLAAAIEAGATEIDVVIASPRFAAPRFAPNMPAPKVMARALDLLTDSLVTKDLQLAQTYNDLVIAGLRPERRLVVLRVIRPRQDLGVDVWDFDDPALPALRAQGASDARVALGR